MPTSKPFAALLTLTVMSAAGRYVLASHSLKIPGTTLLLENVLFAFILAWWVRADRKARHFDASYEFEALVVFFWFVALPYYLFRTRRFRGVLMTVGLFAIFITPLFVEAFPRVWTDTHR
ncbi:MAG: hypothetical protein WB987_10890 [Candidatus Acidiferrales bacterium]